MTVETELVLEWGPLHWTCPGCRQFNVSDDPDVFEVPTRCEHCGLHWQLCPADCYMEDHCPICGGETGGLVRVEVAA